jgi:hypothetical protein
MTSANIISCIFQRHRTTLPVLEHVETLPLSSKCRVPSVDPTLISNGRSLLRVASLLPSRTYVVWTNIISPRLAEAGETTFAFVVVLPGISS